MNACLFKRLVCDTEHDIYWCDYCMRDIIMCGPAKNITWGHHAVWASLEHYMGISCSLGQYVTLHGDIMQCGPAYNITWEYHAVWASPEH